MKQIIPFKKEIMFKTMISKITSISLEHTLSLENSDTIKGDFIVSGSYKMTEASQIDEEFSYKVPIEITIDDKYDTKNISLDIDDFVYEVVDEEKLLLHIDLCIDNLELKEEKEDEATKEEVISSYPEYEEEVLPQEELARGEELETVEDEDLFLDTSTSEPLEVPVNIESIKTFNANEVDTNTNTTSMTVEQDTQSTTENSVTSIFSAFKNTDETFATYCVYIIREGDNLDTVINKYKTSRDTLAEYNDLSDIRIGTKLIIPNSNE